MSEATEKQDKPSKPSAKAQALAARLMAVQAVYQASQNDQSIRDAAKEYINHRVGMEIEGEVMVEPDKILYQKIVTGVDERESDLLEVVSHHFGPEKQKSEPLITAILLCGTLELMAHDDVDSPIIINDYLNVAHAFFEQSEVGLLNGVLDAVAKSLRDLA